jgi:hypothetical protein
MLSLIERAARDLCLDVRGLSVFFSQGGSRALTAGTFPSISKVE